MLSIIGLLEGEYYIGLRDSAKPSSGTIKLQFPLESKNF